MQAKLDLYPSPTPDGDYLAFFSADLPKNTSLPAMTYTSPFDKTKGIMKKDSAGNIPTSDDRVIILLDRSGSMGSHCNKILTQSLPLMFKTLNYPPHHMIDLVMFCSKTEHFQHRVDEFPTLKYQQRGSTAMHTAFTTLKKILDSYPHGSFVKILTISDGQVDKIEETVKLAGELYAHIQTNLAHKLTISSQSCRLFTASYASPDSRALSCVLQFSTESITTPTLIDLNVLSYDDKILMESGDLSPAEADRIETTTPLGHGKAFAQLFLHSTSVVATIAAQKELYDAYTYLQFDPQRTPADLDPVTAKGLSDLAMFKAHPWSNPMPFATIPVNQNEYLFWIDKAKFDAYIAQIPANDGVHPCAFTLSDSIPLDITVNAVITPDQYSIILARRLDYYMMMSKLLRVVGNPQSLQQLKIMSDYFIQLETQVFKDSTEAVEAGVSMGLRARINDCKAKLAKVRSRLGLRIAEVANMDAKQRFDSAQAASFLRSSTSSNAGRGLVNRAGDALDFDNIVRGEIRQLAKAFPEFEAQFSVDDEASHKQSFVSLATSLDGLRAVTELALTAVDGQVFNSIDEVGNKETLLDTISALEILSFLNIVGVPVQATVGDYPDPFRYTIKAIFSGHYCSLSDIIAQHAVAEENDRIKPLQIPGFGDNGIIDNVIPLFDSPKIFQFLYQNAPQSLNYYASVGMRRMIADVSGTLPALLSAAFVKMIRVVAVEPTEVNISALQNIYTSLKTCSTVKYNLKTYQELIDALLFDLAQKDKPEVEKKLPIITTNLAQLILPLLDLYQSIVIDKKINSGLVIALKDRSVKYNQLESISAEFASHFNVLFRAIYTNEVWTVIRSMYRGKQDSPQIIQSSLDSLMGFETSFTPSVNGITFNIDSNDPIYPPFDVNNPTICLPGEKREQIAFLKSTTFLDKQHTINFLNVLLLIPSIAELLSSGNISHVANIKIFHTSESIFQQMKEAELDEKSSATSACREQIKENIIKLYPSVFFSSTTNHPQVVPINDKIISLVKLFNIALAFTHSVLDQRYDIQACISELPDWNIFLAQAPPTPQIESIASFHPIFTNLQQEFLKKSKNVYQKVIQAEIDKINCEIAMEYKKLLLDAPNMIEFEALLSDGIIRHNKRFFYPSYQNSNFRDFFTSLTAKSNPVPLLCDKIITVINGKNDKGETVWNNGNLLFLDNFHNISLLFYKDEEDKNAARGKWIQFSKQYLERKRAEMWKYRESDLPNRHSHHLTRPSFWGLGYSTMDEFKANVSEDVYIAYCIDHADCCGFRPKAARICHWKSAMGDKEYHLHHQKKQ